MGRQYFSTIIKQVIIITVCLIGFMFLVPFVLSILKIIEPGTTQSFLVYYVIVSLLSLTPIPKFKKKVGNEGAVTIPISYTISLLIPFMIGYYTYLDSFGQLAVLPRSIGFIFLPQAVICCIVSWIFYAVTIFKKKKEIL